MKELLLRFYLIILMFAVGTGFGYAQTQNKAELKRVNIQESSSSTQIQSTSEIVPVLKKASAHQTQQSDTTAITRNDIGNVPKLKRVDNNTTR